MVTASGIKKGQSASRSYKHMKPHRISRRLSASLILAVALIATIVSMIIYFRAIDIEHKALQTKADEVIAYLVGAVELPLWHLDNAAVELIGKTVSQDELILKLVIRDDADILFSLQKEYDDDGISRKSPVMHKGESIGEIDLLLTKRLYQQASRRLLSNFIVGTLLILICLLLVTDFLIRTFLRKPINTLNNIVTRYAEGSYDTTEDALPYHEFLPVGKVLHQMGQKIREQLMSLQMAEEKFRTIFENAVEGIFQATPEGRVNNANPAMATLLGYDSPDEMLNSIVDARNQLYVEPTDRDDLIRRLKESETVSGFEARLYRKDHGVIWVAMNVRGIKDSSGELAYLEGFVTDISNRKRADQELIHYRDHLEELVTERTNALAEAKEQAETANAAKSDFLARMSHEIRTPLNAVTGLTNVVLNTELTEVQRDYLEKVQLASKNLLNIINDILDFSKMEAGQMGLASTIFDLDEVLEHLADLFANQIGNKDLELIFSASPQVPRQYVGDAGRLSQVLTNLIENAIKFTDQGEIVVGVKLSEGEAQGKGAIVLEFQVSDTGAGIAADVLPSLFDPFTQADSSLTRQHDGTGLGLAICHRLIELMGGRIWARSTLGKGSTFYFTVLLSIIKKASHRFTAPEDFHGLKTLVVDDSASSRQMLKDLLESFKFNVSTAEDGQKALEMLSAATAEAPYQLVLMDWKMPGMDGLTAARRIRELDLKVPLSVVSGSKSRASSLSSMVDGSPPTGRSHSSTPIIIMVTAYGQLLVHKQIDTTITDGMLLKPIKPSQLFNTIMELLVPAMAARPRPRNKRDLSISPLAGGRVLVVEDSELNRDVVVALLKDFGLKVQTAENGKIAVEHLSRAGVSAYDAVLMDIQMPVMDGYEATRQIRILETTLKSQEDCRSGVDSEAGRSRVPIIALTAHALKGEKEKCLSAGMDDYLSKPIVEDVLNRVLHKWISPVAHVPQSDRRSKVRRAQDARAVLDVDAALKRLGGRTQLYRKVIQKFAPEFQNAPETIQRAMDDDDLETVRRIAHSIKGAGAGIGAMALSDAAAKLEKSSAGSAAELASLLKPLELEMGAALEAIQGYLASEVEPEAKTLTSGKTAESSELGTHRRLSRLEAFLSSGDMRAIAAWEEMKDSFHGMGVDLMVEDLDKMMDRLDFDGALRSLKVLTTYADEG